MSKDKEPSFRQRRNAIIATGAALMAAASGLWHFDIHAPAITIGLIGAFTFFAADDLASN